MVQSLTISVTGTTVSNVTYTAILHDAVTSSRDQSGAKIIIVNANHEGTKTNNDVEAFLFWDENTKYFPFDLFHHFPNIEVLQAPIIFQEMDSPINGHFMNAKKLDRLYISNQNFHKMGSSVFEGATAVTWIYLEHDHIEIIDAATFRGLKTLKKLSLKGNLIRTLSNETFSTLVDLEFLNLNSNLITTLQAGLFMLNKKLKTILLDANLLLNIEDQIFPSINHDQLQFMDNLCISDIFFSPEGLHKIASKSCTTVKSPSEIFTKYKEQIKNPHNCDAHDKDQIIDLKDQIKRLESEIAELEKDNSELSDILSSVTSMQVCHLNNEHDEF